jgi:hypothetical protein
LVVEVVVIVDNDAVVESNAVEDADDDDNDGAAVDVDEEHVSRKSRDVDAVEDETESPVAAFLFRKQQTISNLSQNMKEQQAYNVGKVVPRKSVGINSKEGQKDRDRSEAELLFENNSKPGHKPVK